MSTKLGEGIIASLQFARQLPIHTSCGILRREPVRLSIEDEAHLDADEREQLLHGRAHDEAWTLDFFDVYSREFETVVVSRSFADAVADAMRHSASGIAADQESGTAARNPGHATHPHAPNEVIVKVGRFMLAQTQPNARVVWDAALGTDGRLQAPQICLDFAGVGVDLDDVPDASEFASSQTPLLAPHFEAQRVVSDVLFDTRGQLGVSDENSSVQGQRSINDVPSERIGEEMAALDALGQTILDDDSELVDTITDSAQADMIVEASAADDINNAIASEHVLAHHERHRVPTRGPDSSEMDPEGGVDGDRAQLTHTLIMNRQLLNLRSSTRSEYARLALHHASSHGDVIKKSRAPGTAGEGETKLENMVNAAYGSLDEEEVGGPPVIYGMAWECSGHGHVRKAKQHAVPISQRFYNRIARRAEESLREGVSPNFSVEVRLVRQQAPQTSRFMIFFAWLLLFCAVLAVGTGGAVFAQLPDKIWMHQPILGSLWRNQLALLCLLPMASYEFMFNIKPLDRWGFKRPKTWGLVLVNSFLVSVWSGAFVVAMNHTTLERIYIADNFYPLLILVWRRWISALRRQIGLARGNYRYSTVPSHRKVCLGATTTQWLGVMLAISGAVLSIYSGNVRSFVFFSDSDQAFGDGIAFLGALAGATYIILGGKIRSMIPLYVMSVPVIALSCVWFAAYTLIFEGSKFGELFIINADFSELNVLLWLGFVTGAGGLVFVTVAHDHIAPFINSAFFFLTPAIGGITTYVLTGDHHPSWITWIGVSMVIASSILIAHGFGGMKRIPWVEERIVRSRWAPQHARVTFVLDEHSHHHVSHGTAAMGGNEF